MIRIYDTRMHKKVDLETLEHGKVKMYVCGPTVYNYIHIGNARTFISFDMIRRYLEWRKFEVIFVQNITDVDDKIINRAKELGIPERRLTDEIIEKFRNLTDDVGSLQPDITPRPTEYMDKIISYVDDLVNNGSAYKADGDVYFRVASVPTYGELSGNTPERLISGARIEVNSQKESPIDFALWKKTEEGIKWETPFGEGRPGWHTECCVMISSIFHDNGGYIDIHGGGFDLKFPHHENEIAQSRAHNHNGLAKYWLHNGFINIDNEKMSKSLGNVLLAKDVVKEYGGIAFRLMVLNTHYRAPLTFSAETILEAQKTLVKIQTAYKQAEVALQLADVDLNSLSMGNQDKFYDELCNDLNTPNAIAELLAEIKRLNQALRTNPLDTANLGEAFANVRDYLDVLGIRVKETPLNEEDKSLYRAYVAAKKEKDFAKSDELRAKLIEKGIL